MRLGEVVQFVDRRVGNATATVLSVSESLGIVRQDALFNKRIALKDLTKYRLVREGDIVYNPFLLWNRAVGGCFITDGGCVSPAYVVLSPRLSGTTRFVHYLMRSTAFGELINGMASGTVTRRRTVPVADVLNLDLDIPPLGEQQAISEVLEAIDDKIESNRQICYNIDGLLSAEVVHAISSDLDARTCTFGDLVERISVGVNPALLEDSVPYVGLEHIPRGSMILDDWGDSKGLGSGKAQFIENDILFGKLRPYLKKVGVAPISGICSTDVLVLRPISGTPLPVALAIAASDPLIDYASAASTGTRMPRVSWEYLAAFQTEVPGPDKMQDLGDRLRPLLELAMDFVAQNRNLVAIRDALLPALLSGRIRVPAVAELVESK